MTKLANFAIIAVHYNSDNTHIDSVRRCELDANNNLGTAEEKTRKAVVDAIDNKGLTYITVVRQNGTWQVGAEVGTVEVNKKKYLRTDGNKVERDNLGNLPTF